MHPATYIWLAFVAVLFLVVRQFLRKWGLGGSASAGDYGLGKLFYYGAFIVLWIAPSIIFWCVVDVWRS